jgi:hypothetical protein
LSVLWVATWKIAYRVNGVDGLGRRPALQSRKFAGNRPPNRRQAVK